MILLIDNYDSFAHNLGRYLCRLKQEVRVVRNDKILVSDVESLIEKEEIKAVVISPGPGDPDSAGICLELVEKFHNRVPILGICLGHQVIVQAFGGKVIQWKRPIHGMADAVHHDGRNLFGILPSPFLAGRYHSLVAENESIPACLNVLAHLEDGTIMAVEHKDFPVVGLQFHPESILTQFGPHLLEGFLRLAGLSDRNDQQSKLLCDQIFPPSHGTNDDLMAICSDGDHKKHRTELQASYPAGCVPVDRRTELPE